MRNRDNNNEEIRKLEGEIRKLGIPYASEEPEPLYWTNFRVRVMEQIAEKENKATWPARIGQFLAEHLLGAGIAVSVACLLVAAILWMQPSGGEAPSGGAPQIAAVQQPPAASAPIAQPPLQAVAQATKATYETHRIHASYAMVSKRQPTEDLASVAMPLATDDEAVSLQSLSQPELEAVLQGLQANE